MSLDKMRRVGHFKLRSGLHSGLYYKSLDWIQVDPAGFSEELGRFVKTLLAPFSLADVVICPALGAIPVAFDVARLKGIKFTFAELDANKQFTLRRTSIIPNQYYLVVDDTRSTGEASEQVATLVRQSGGIVCGFLSIVDRSPRQALSAPKTSMYQVESIAQPIDKCPQCREGIPLEVPGSRWV